MNSAGVVILILAIVFMLALMYLWCWWYCTHGRCCGSANHKKSKNGPDYVRTSSIVNEEKPPYTPNNNNNNNNINVNSYKVTPFTSSKQDVKYPSAPEAKILTSASLKQSTLHATDAKYDMTARVASPPPPSTNVDLKFQKTSPPSPHLEKKMSAASFLLGNPPYSTTSIQVKEKNYQPLDRKFSSGLTSDFSSRIPFNNSMTTSTYAERKMSQFSEKSDSIPAWLPEKRSVSPYRSQSPFEPSASSRYSVTSNSDKEFSKYTGIRSYGNATTTTTTTTSKKDITDGDAEQTVTIKVKADEADKISSILNNAVRSGELSSAEAVTEEKAVDVKKMLERYEHAKSTEPEGGSSTTILSGTESKTVLLSERSPSFLPTITTTTADEGVTSGVSNIVEKVLSSVHESAPGYTIEKTVTTSLKEEGKITETTMTTRKSSSSMKEDGEDSS